MYKEHLEIECSTCSGTGLYHGFKELNREYVICHCGGTGSIKIGYIPFTGRKRRKGVKKIAVWDHETTPATVKFITYKEFLADSAYYLTFETR